MSADVNLENDVKKKKLLCDFANRQQLLKNDSRSPVKTGFWLLASYLPIKSIKPINTNFMR